MKKLILLALLSAFVMPSMAQEQEDHVVRRGKYKAAETDTIVKVKKQRKKRVKNDTTWFNSFSVGFHGGNILPVDIKGIEMSSPYSINLPGSKESLSMLGLSVSYERLKRNGLFLYGPGINLNTYGDDYIFDFFSLDVYMHGRIEKQTGVDFLGFNMSHLHPFAGASLGVSYYNMFFTAKYEYKRYYNYDYGSHEIRNGHFRYGHADNVLKLYLDLRLGFTIDVGRYASIGINYSAILFPTAKYNTNLYKYYPEFVNILNDTPTYHDYGGYYYDYHTIPFEKNGTTIGILHGLELSFRF